MNSRSKASRPPVLDIIASVGVITALVLVSGLLRSRFPAPASNVWLWLAATIGVWVSYKASVGRRKSAVRGTLVFAAVFLLIQMMMQAAIGFGGVSF